MIAKTLILDRLGQQALVVPEVMRRAVAGNDRAKYLLALLREAAQQAMVPRFPAPDLRAERLASGCAEEWLDAVIAGSRPAGDGRVAMPEAQRIVGDLFAALGDMAAPFALCGLESESQTFGRRIASLAAATPEAAEGVLPLGWIAGATATGRDGFDTIQQLVMDLSRALSSMQTRFAPDGIDGASTWGVDPDDRAMVTAFMAGVNRTSVLKFDHPGLATSATRDGQRLVIQNDIGTTDAHVLVVHVQDLTAHVTYTDVHARRARFFRNLFSSWGVDWRLAEVASDDGFETESYLHCTGRFAAADRDSLLRFLTFLGSRLVFLIDWNKARKALRTFLPAEEAVDLLSWAAEQEVGHRAFLQIGGERLIWEAMEHGAGGRLRLGDRLEDLLGPVRSTAWLRDVLRLASDGLKRGRAVRFLREEVRSELGRHLRGAGQDLIAGSLAHAETLYAIGTSLHAASRTLSQGTEGLKARVKFASRTMELERDADSRLADLATITRRSALSPAILRFTEAADRAADHLEEAAFLLTLAQAPPPRLCDALQRLTRLVAEAAGAWLAALTATRHLQRTGAREDIDDALAAVDRVLQRENDSDLALRGLVRALHEEAVEFRTFSLFGDLGRLCERAADQLSHAGHLLREHLLDDAMGA